MSPPIRSDGLTHREHSAVVMNLALTIADSAARTEVECFAKSAFRDDNGRSIYDLTATDAWAGDGCAEEDIAAAQRAARYIRLRQPHLPYRLVEVGGNPNLVMFEEAR